MDCFKTRNKHDVFLNFLNKDTITEQVKYTIVIDNKTEEYYSLMDVIRRADGFMPTEQSVNGLHIYSITRKEQIWYVAFVNGKEIARKDCMILKRILGQRSK